MKKNRYNIYEYEKMPVCAFTGLTIEEVANLLKTSVNSAYPKKTETLHEGKYLVTREGDIRRNRYLDSFALACQELGHFTGETMDHAMKRILARVMLEPNDYERWLKDHD